MDIQSPLAQKVIIPLLLILPGWCIGALINYLADTLPKTRRFSKPVCPHCNNAWNWKNYLFLAKCSHCEKSPPTRHRDTQFLAVIIVLFLWSYPSPRISFWWAAALLAYFGLVTIIDIEHRLILHPVSLAGFILCSTYGIIHHGLWLTFLGAVSGFGIMLALYWLGIQFSKLISRIRKQPVEEVALGFGDVALSTVIGALLGWPGITAGLMLAIILGGLFSLGYILVKMAQKKYHLLTAIPYGPFLIISALVLLFR